MRQTGTMWRLKVYSYGRLRFVTICKNESFARNRGHRSVTMVRQAANIGRLKVYSYGRFRFVTVYHSITRAPVIREQL